MRKLILFTFSAIMILACNNDDSSTTINNDLNIEGEYNGTFERGEIKSIVELSLNDGVFEGNSEVINLPAICYGNYYTSDNIITFENLCPWTAYFGNTLVLYGEWTYTFENNTVVLINDFGDKYTLVKQ